MNIFSGVTWVQCKQQYSTSTSTMTREFLFRKRFYFFLCPSIWNHLEIVHIHFVESTASILKRLVCVSYQIGFYGDGDAFLHLKRKQSRLMDSKNEHVSCHDLWWRKVCVFHSICQRVKLGSLIFSYDIVSNGRHRIAIMFHSCWRFMLTFHSKFSQHNCWHFWFVNKQCGYFWGRWECLFSHEIPVECVCLTVTNAFPKITQSIWSARKESTLIVFSFEHFVGSMPLWHDMHWVGFLHWYTGGQNEQTKKYNREMSYSKKSRVI